MIVICFKKIHEKHQTSRLFDFFFIYITSIYIFFRNPTKSASVEVGKDIQYLTQNAWLKGWKRRGRRKLKYNERWKSLKNERIGGLLCFCRGLLHESGRGAQRNKWQVNWTTLKRRLLGKRVEAPTGPIIVLTSYTWSAAVVHSIHYWYTNEIQNTVQYNFITPY